MKRHVLSNYLLAGASVVALGCNPHKPDKQDKVPTAQTTADTTSSKELQDTVPILHLDSVHIDDKIKNELTKPHPLEAIVKAIDPDVRICVMPEYDWLQEMTGAKNVDSASQEKWDLKIFKAAEMRLDHYFPELKHDKVLKANMYNSVSESADTDDNAHTATFTDKAGNRYAIITIGRSKVSEKEFFQFHLKDKALCERAIKNNKVDISKLSKNDTWYHELAHVFDGIDQHVGSSIESYIYDRHRAEAHGCAMEYLKVLQETGDLGLVRLICDMNMLSAFYHGDYRYTENPETGQATSSAMAYFNHKLFDNIKQAYAASPRHLKELSDKQLLKLSQKIADQSIYTFEEFNDMEKMALSARLKYLKLPTVQDTMMNYYPPPEKIQYIRGHADYKEPDIETPLAIRAINDGYLDKTKPWVIALLQAERRVFGPAKGRSY